MVELTKLVKHNEGIGQPNAAAFQPGQGTQNVCGAEWGAATAFAVHEQNTAVLALQCLREVVEGLEVGRVARHDRELLSDGVCKVR